MCCVISTNGINHLIIREFIWLFWFYEWGNNSERETSSMLQPRIRNQALLAPRPLLLRLVINIGVLHILYESTISVQCSSDLVYNLMSIDKFIYTCNQRNPRYKTFPSPWEVPSSPVLSPSVTSLTVGRFTCCSPSYKRNSAVWTFKSSFWLYDEPWRYFLVAASMSSSLLLLLIVCILFFFSNIWICYTLFFHSVNDGHLGFQIFGYH